MLQAADLTIRLHPEDDVVIARVELPAGTLVPKESVRVSVRVPPGHKIAVRDVAKGAPVHRYNQIIGFATQPIKAGDHVHVHNVAMGDFQRDYAFCSLAKNTIYCNWDSPPLLAEEDSNDQSPDGQLAREAKATFTRDDA